VSATEQERPGAADPAETSVRKPGTFTSESGREAAALRTARSLERRSGASDAAIEKALRDKAKTDPRAAEVLLRWLSRPRSDAPEDDLDGLTRSELETLHERLTILCSMEESAFAALVSAAGRSV